MMMIKGSKTFMIIKGRPCLMIYIICTTLSSIYLDILYPYYCDNSVVTKQHIFEDNHYDFSNEYNYQMRIC